MIHTLNINKQINDRHAIFKLEGALNVTTSIQLENELRPIIDNLDEIMFDFKGVNILTSAGIRVLMAAAQEVNGRGKISIINCSDVVKEIFEVTALVNDLHVS